MSECLRNAKCSIQHSSVLSYSKRFRRFAVRCSFPLVSWLHTWKAHTCCMLWGSPAQLSLFLLLYKRRAPLSITLGHFAPLQSCLQLTHTRNMLMLPFMVSFILEAKRNFVSIHWCSLGQNCQLIASVLDVAAQRF